MYTFCIFVYMRIPSDKLMSVCVSGHAKICRSQTCRKQAMAVKDTYLARDLVCADGVLNWLLSEAKVSASQHKRSGDAEPHAQERENCDMHRRVNVR